MEIRRAVESDFTAIESLFTTLDFLESKNEAGMVFDLARDFSDAVRVLPNDRPKHRIGADAQGLVHLLHIRSHPKIKAFFPELTRPARLVGRRQYFRSKTV